MFVDSLFFSQRRLIFTLGRINVRKRQSFDWSCLCGPDLIFIQLHYFLFHSGKIITALEIHVLMIQMRGQTRQQISDVCTRLYIHVKWSKINLNTTIFPTKFLRMYVLCTAFWRWLLQTSLYEIGKNSHKHLLDLWVL